VAGNHCHSRRRFLEQAAVAVSATPFVASAYGQPSTLPRRREVATLDAGLDRITRRLKARCITVTVCHCVEIGLPAGVRTWIGRPLRRKERGK